MKEDWIDVKKIDLKRLPPEVVHWKTRALLAESAIKDIKRLINLKEELLRAHSPNEYLGYIRSDDENFKTNWNTDTGR